MQTCMAPEKNKSLFCLLPTDSEGHKVFSQKRLSKS